MKVKYKSIKKTISEVNEYTIKVDVKCDINNIMCGGELKVYSFYILVKFLSA